MPPNMVGIKSAYVEDEERGKYTIQDFLLSQYVESNFQYSVFLEDLKNTNYRAYLRALPDTTFWNQFDLDPKQVAFLKEHYWSGREFASYPILGLDYCQIREYYIWKTQKLNEAYLIFEGYSPAETVKNNFFEEYQSMKKGKSQKKFWDGYRLTTDTEFLRLGNYKEQYNWDIKPKRNKRFERWLQKNDDYSHLIDRTEEEMISVELQNLLKKIGIESVKNTRIDGRNSFPKKAIVDPKLRSSLGKRYKSGYVLNCKYSDYNYPISNNAEIIDHKKIIYYKITEKGTEITTTDSGSIVGLRLANMSIRQL